VKIDESKRYEPPTLASINLSAREKEEMNKIQDLIDILHTTDHDWIEDLEIIPPLKPQKITRQQKSDHAALLMTPPTTPEYPEQSESPEMNQNEGQTPPETFPSSLGGGNNKPEPPRRTRESDPETDHELRRSKRQKTRTKRAEEMPNQDLRRRAFVADNNYLVDK
jgi:hypothetical protein